MPTPKNGFQILNQHPKKHTFKKNTLFFNVLLPKFHRTKQPRSKRYIHFIYDKDSKLNHLEG